MKYEVSQKLPEGIFLDGIYCDLVSPDRIVIPPDMKIAFREEFDSRRIDLIAGAISDGSYGVLPLVVGADSQSNASDLRLLHRPAVFQALKQLGYDEIPVIAVADGSFRIETAQPNDLMYLSELGTKIDRLETVEVNRLILEDSITDETHIKELQYQLSTDGQKVPVWLRARMTDGGLVYDVIDGFHRSASFTALELKYIQARVTYGMSDEELYDQRVLCANSVRSVQFARTVSLIQKSFAESEWSKKYELKLSQLLSMAYFKDSVDQSGKRLKVPPDVADRMIAWVERKVMLWQSELGTVLQQVRAAELSYDEIINQVRLTSGGGHKGSGVLTPVKFIAMVNEIPEDRYLQREMVDLIRIHNLNTEDTARVARVMKSVRDKRATLAMLKQDPLAIAGEILGDDGQVKPKKRSGHQTINLKPVDAPRQDKHSVFDSRDAVEPGALAWLDILKNITAPEKMVVKALFVEGMTVEELMKMTGLTENRIATLVWSAQQKYAVYVEDRNFLDSMH